MYDDCVSHDQDVRPPMLNVISLSIIWAMTCRTTDIDYQLSVHHDVDVTWCKTTHADYELRPANTSDLSGSLPFLRSISRLYNLEPTLELEWNHRSCNLMLLWIFTQTVIVASGSCTKTASSIWPTCVYKSLPIVEYLLSWFSTGVMPYWHVTYINLKKS